MISKRIKFKLFFLFYFENLAGLPEFRKEP